ncbi:MAG: OstA-like protein [Brumimicrobium sp.]
MKGVNKIFKIALLIGGAIFLFSNLSYSQDVIELLDGADDIKLDSKKNWIVTGNVVFKSGSNKLYCDSAYFNSNLNHVKAYKNVHFNKLDTLNLFCDSMHFDANKDYIKLYGNVRIRNNEYRLITDSMDYDLKRDVGIYKNKGVITSISSNDYLSSTVGYFYPKSEQFNFSKNVLYKNDDYTITTDTLRFNTSSKKSYFYGPTTIVGDSMNMYCEEGWYDINNDEGVLQKNAYVDRADIFISADSLYYSSIDSIYIAKYNVNLVDTTNKISFTGDYAYNSDIEKYGFITGHTLAKRFDDKDTLYIHADTLYNFLDSVSEPKLMLAYKNVKLYRGDMQGVCDSLSYNRQNGEMNLYTAPILWARNAQLTGDTISVYEKDDEIQRAFIRKNGLIVTNVDSTNYFNQVTGTSMVAIFDSTEIKRVEIDGNAKTIYFLEQEDENDTLIVVERKGMNRLYSSNITLRFEKGDITTATYRDIPDGVLYPMNKIDKKEERVEIFSWKEELRPLSWQQIIYSKKEEREILRNFNAMAPF